MKLGIFYIALLFTLLQTVGCHVQNPSFPDETGKNRNTGSLPDDKKKSINELGTTEAIKSRFEDHINNSGLDASKDQAEKYQYYIPAEDIGKRSLIAPGQLAQTGEFQEGNPGFENDVQPQLPDFFKSGRTSQEIFISAVFDNDIFDYTDYYYTNGISFEFYHPAISASPISKLLPGLRNSVNYYSLILLQNMYTPLKLENTVPLAGDRPFAAYFTIGHHKISLSAFKHQRLETELSLGVIGPAALGGVAQDAIHSNEPVGWVNQVRNDIVANYSIRFDQGLYSGRNFELAAVAGGQAGTLYDNIMAGVFLQFGKMNDRYGSVFQTTGYQKPFRNRIRYYFSLDLKNKLIFYDATLQGGMFNHQSVYKLNGDQINRYLFTGTASVGLGFGRYSLEAGQVFLTPEFEGGKYHLWFRIKNIFYID
jgi:lipid A 3-O-deacylase